MICKNCEQDFSGNFCNNCGQSAEVRKIDFKYLHHEIPNSILQLNRGFLFTIIQLFTRPGHSIREFLKGKRKSHYKPIAFLLVTSTIYVLSAFLFDKSTVIDDIITGWKQGMTNRNETFNSGIFKWLSRNQTYIILLILPFFSLASYVAFIKSKYNYFEHLVLNIYITGQQLIIYFAFSFIFFGDSVFSMLPFLFGIIYNFWVFNQFFKDKKKLHTLGSLLLAYAIFIVEIGVLIFVSAIIKVFVQEYRG